MMKKYLFLAFLVAVSNSWFWRLLKLDFIVGILCLSLSLILSFSLNFRLSKLVKMSLVLITIIVSATSLAKGSERGLFRIRQLEIITYERRHEYFAKEMGRIYTNRIGIFYLKNLRPLVTRLEKKIFYTIDPNLYFFAGHPRERTGASDFEKYPFVLFPLFLIGLLSFLKKIDKLILYYALLAILVSALLDFGYNLGPVLFYPVINAILYIGILNVLGYINKYEK